MSAALAGTALVAAASAITSEPPRNAALHAFFERQFLRGLERLEVRRFHNAILDDGARPLDPLEARIGEWIRKETGRKK